MRELDLEPHTEARAPALEAGPAAGGDPLRIGIVGAGRAGRSFATAIVEGGHELAGPVGRGETLPQALDLVLICVPDSEIAPVASSLDVEAPIGHCSGAHGLAILPAGKSFCLHPLMTLSGDPGELEGAYAAIDASDPETMALITRLALELGMTPVRIESDDRAAYHAAASIASNFLVALEGAAEDLARTAGLPREALVPLVERTVSNWASAGASRSLTGPVARGDRETVLKQRSEVERRLPWFLPAFDELCIATGRLAGREFRP